MVGHMMAHGPPDTAAKAHGAAVQFQSVKKWRITERRRAFMGLLMEGAPHPWMTEEAAARAKKRRSLMEDNPASG